MSERTLQTYYVFKFQDYVIEVLWVEYPGGGMCWEYRISQNDKVLVETEDEYGRAVVAAAAAFNWLVENA